MKKWWVIWFFSIPICLFSYLYSFFITGKISYLSQSECKPMFIFTPQDVQYCSDVYPIDVFLISLREEPLSYVCIISGLYFVGFLFYKVLKLIKNGN